MKNIISNNFLRYTIYVCLLWTILFIGLGSWFRVKEKEEQIELIKHDARTNLNKDRAFRFWAAGHGGLYVPQTEKTPANPYLAHIPNRDIVLQDSVKYTLMNGAYILRQLLEDYEKLYGVNGHLTSLKPLRPENYPDPWEKQALSSFERGTKEAVEFVSINEAIYLRVMEPLEIKESCLKCHGHQGYKVGDIRGGVGISVLTQPYFERANASWLFDVFLLFWIWLLGLFGIIWSSTYIKKRVQERDEAQEKINQDKVLFQKVFDDFPESLMVIDLDYNVVVKNEKIAEFSEKADSYKCYELSHHSSEPCSGGDHICPLKEVINTKKIVEVEHIHFDQEGKEVPVKIVATPIFDKNGEVVQIIESSIDISKQRIAEQELRKSENKYKLLYDNSLVAMYSITLDGKPVNVNDVGLTLLGYSSKAEFFEKFQASKHWVNPEEEESLKKKLLKDGEVVNYEARTKSLDGRIFWTASSFTLNIARNVLEAVVVDISDLKEAEIALATSEERMVRATAGANVGIWEWDIVKDEIHWSDSVFALFNLNRDEFEKTYKAYLDIIHEEDKKLLVDTVARSLNNPEIPFICEYRVVWSDNTIHWHIAKADVKRDENGNPLLMAGTVADITLRKQAEIALSLSEEEYRFLADNSIDLIWKIDMEMNHIFATNSVLSVLGFTRDEFLNINTSKLYRPSEFERIQGILVQELSKGCPHEGITFETAHIQKSGKEISVEINAKIIYDKSQKPIYIQGVTRDITERKFAREQEIDHLRQIQTISANVPNIIWKSDIDENGGFINSYISEIVDEFLGLPANTINHSWDNYFKYVKPQYLPQIAKVFKNAIADFGTLISFDYEVVKGNGEIAWLASKGHCQSLNGKLTVYGSTIDITDRKRAEEELKLERNRVASILDAIPDGVYIVSKDYDIEYVNPVILREFGSVNSRKCYNYFHGRNDVCPWCKNAEVMSGDSVNWEWFSSKNGRHYELFDAPYVNPDGTISKFEIFHDITDRKRAEEELLERERFLDALIIQSPFAMWISDDKGTMIRANPALKKFLNLSDEQLIGKYNVFEDTIAINQGLVPLIRSVFEKGETVSFITEWDGKELPHLDYSSSNKVVVDATMFPIHDSTGVLSNVVLSWVDISDRKRIEKEKQELERQIQHAQKLESLGVLAGGIAHDFNNLLVAILGNAELALSDLSSMSPVRINLEQIEVASKRAADLAKQMLAYSGKGHFVIEPIDAGDLVQEMIYLLEVSISKSVVLKYNFAQNLPLFNGDVTQIRQIVMNLITNASEAIGDRSGVIAVSTGAMNCDHDYLNATNTNIGDEIPEGDYVYFEVADTGCGMDDKTIEKIFDPFYTTKFTGRGLGMSAVLGIVRGHKGAINIYSELGRGTTFKVLFPINNSQEVSEKIATKQEIEHWDDGGTILLADDEETICVVAKQMIERLGFDVIVAHDGLEAVNLFNEHKDEITGVLLDLTMPRMNGEDAYREMRRIDPEVKVILCSGYSEQEATQHFSGKGLTGFIEKPFTMAMLIEAFKGLVK